MPQPVHVGDFKDATGAYWLQIWRDDHGIFGELSHPVLDADSPTSRLYDVASAPRTKRLSFRARFADGDVRFSGVLSRRRVRGIMTSKSQSEHVVLRTFHGDAMPWVSRAQFDCAMTLFRR